MILLYSVQIVASADYRLYQLCDYDSHWIHVHIDGVSNWKPGTVIHFFDK